MLKIRVPASTSNLGSGFDTFGLALQLYLDVEIGVISSGLKFNISGEDFNEIPENENNLVFKAIEKLARRYGRKIPGLRINIRNEIPLLRGLGSSGAAIIAGLIAGVEVLGLQVSNDEMLSIGAEIEGHPDNVSASLNGGLSVNAIDGKRLISKKIEVDERLKCVLAIPNDTISTNTARAALPNMVSHGDAIFNVQRSALLVECFMNGKFKDLKTAMQDRLHQPYRKALIAGYDEFEKAGYENGALGVCISGSGSAILGLALEEYTTLKTVWEKKSRDLGIRSRVMAFSCDNTGAVIEK